MEIAARLTERFALLCRSCATTPTVDLDAGSLELVCPGCGNTLAFGARKSANREPCACAAWTRPVGEAPGRFHHPDCPRAGQSVRVVRITCNGNSVFDEDVRGALSGLADGDDYVYEVELLTLTRDAYDALPEFAGF